MRVSNPKINKEAVKTLVVLHGQREAARIAGLNENTVRSWAMRYGWSQAQPQTSQPICNQTPADAVATFIQANEKRTRWSLSRAHRLQAAKAARGKLGPKETLQVAQGAAITHGWKTQEVGQTQVAVNIAILDSAPVT